jgi:host factor-I protein
MLKSASQGRIVGAYRKAVPIALPESSWRSNEPEKGDRRMEAKPAQQNIQDSFLNTARKERHNITIYLVSGVKLTGRIRSFDKYSVVLETSNQEQLIFKHAISTVVILRGAHAHIEPKPTAIAPAGESISNAASGTEG